MSRLLMSLAISLTLLGPAVAADYRSATCNPCGPPPCVGPDVKTVGINPVSYQIRIKSVGNQQPNLANQIPYPVPANRDLRVTVSSNFNPSTTGIDLKLTDLGVSPATPTANKVFKTTVATSLVSTWWESSYTIPAADLPASHTFSLKAVYGTSVSSPVVTFKTSP